MVFINATSMPLYLSNKMCLNGLLFNRWWASTKSLTIIAYLGIIFWSEYWLYSLNTIPVIYRYFYQRKVCYSWFQLIIMSCNNIIWKQTVLLNIKFYPCLSVSLHMLWQRNFSFWSKLEMSLIVINETYKHEVYSSTTKFG